MPKQLRRVHITGKAKSTFFQVLHALSIGSSVIHFDHARQMTGKVKKLEVLESGEVYYYIEPMTSGLSGLKADVITYDRMEP